MIKVWCTDSLLAILMELKGQRDVFIIVFKIIILILTNNCLITLHIYLTIQSYHSKNFLLIYYPFVYRQLILN